MKGIRKHTLIFRSLATLLILGLASAFASAERIEDLPQPTDYVSDLAHVLSPQAIARLDRLCAQIDMSAKAQIAVVTVKSLDGDDSSDYATRVFEKWKIGAKGTDRGLLLLLAVDDHRWSFKTGYGLEGILPDGKTGDMGRAMVPYLKSGDYDNALWLGVNQAAQVIAADAKVTLADEPDAVPVRRHTSSTLQIIKLIFILLFFGGFLLLRVLRGFGLFMGGPWIGGGFGGGGGGGGDSGGGFGGFGGGSSGGGGSDGSW